MHNKSPINHYYYIYHYSKTLATFFQPFFFTNKNVFFAERRSTVSPEDPDWKTVLWFVGIWDPIVGTRQRRNDKDILKPWETWKYLANVILETSWKHFSISLGVAIDL